MTPESPDHGMPRLAAIQSDEAGASPLVIVSPPTIAGRLGRPIRRAVWPVWIGVIAIGLGVVSAFVSATMGVAIATGTYSRVRVPTGQVNPFEGVVRYSTPLAGACAAATLLAAIAVLAGIGLILRKPWSTTLMVWWALLKLLCALALSIVFGLFQKAQIDASLTLAAAARPGAAGPPPGVVAGISTGTAVFMAGFLFFWLALLPVFMLIWFTRSGIRKEVASWRHHQVS